MKLKEITGDYPIEGSYVDTEINTLTAFSGKKTDRGLFFAINGGNVDGKKYVDEAVRNGAVAVVADKKIDGVDTVVCKDVREAYAFFSANFYGNPQRKMKIVGTVGTNGKTSTCHVIADILRFAGKKVAVIGTSGVEFDGFCGSTAHTTPDPHLLYYYLDELRKRGAEYTVMEVSAHAIAQKKVAPIRFRALVYTNCTVDHLDYFKDFETYAKVKKSIMKSSDAEVLVVNADDATGREIAEKEACVTYGIKYPADVFAVNIKEKNNGLEYVVNVFDKLYEVRTSLLGLYNVYNELAAATACFVLGVSAETIGSGLCKAKPVNGRMEKVSFPVGSVFVDYAHTPDGLEKSLLFLRKITKGNLYCLFGCGGNRDKEKRPKMGRVAGDIADFVVLTSDNPRYEEPQAIMKDVEEGLRESTRDYICIEKRREAIIYALDMLGDGDTLLVAGKGAEEYQEVMGIKHYFSDKKLIEELGESYGK